jgi:Short C-terminal domain
MQQLTDEGRRVVDGVAQRHGFSSDAVLAMLYAVSAGYGNQAQFNHPEFGGMGQWSSGGMVMIGDMFNNNLKGRVSSLCQELAGLIQGQPLFAMPAQAQTQSQGGGWQGQFAGNCQQQSSNGSVGASLFVPNAPFSNWWPSDLGTAGSTGAQNSLRYAYFPSTRRLAIDQNGQVTVYDTGDHQIGGFSQQQSGDQSLTFTSQFGLVRVADLPVIGGAGATVAPVVAAKAAPVVAMTVPSAGPTAAPPMPEAAASQGAPSRTRASTESSDEIFALLEKLADLHKKGILTDSEYEAKKADLLERL